MAYPLGPPLSAVIVYLDVTIALERGVHFQEPVLVAVARLSGLVDKGPLPAFPPRGTGDAPALPALELLPALDLVIGQNAKVVDEEGRALRNKTRDVLRFLLEELIVHRSLEPHRRYDLPQVQGIGVR